MRLRQVWIALAAAIAGSGAAIAAGSAPAMTYVTGVINVEDMVRVPGTRWIIGSGLADGQRTDGHIYLVSGEDHAVRILLPGRVDYRPDAKAYPDCPGKPDAARFSAHGLSLRHAPGQRDTLYVVHHGERESVEVFTLDGRDENLRLTWIGCVIYPAGVYGNGVAALPGGAFAATSFMDPRDPNAFAKLEARKPMGAVLVWRHKSGWQILPGASSISAPNGIEASADGKTLYVAGAGDETVVRLRVDGTGRPAVIKTGFHTDNLRWGDDGYLYAAGQRDTVQNLLECAPNTDKRCDSPFSVMRIDPKTLAAREIVHDPGHAAFGAASTALKLGGQYWLGTPHGDRIAILPAR
ncbi:MAG TPA: hypothetical protein VJ747_07850 [Stellaceae bacterium]|nr:hypothetical protein [Stellaceae bacterium]